MFLYLKQRLCLNQMENDYRGYINITCTINLNCMTPFHIYMVMFILWYTNNKTDKLEFCCTKHSVRLTILQSADLEKTVTLDIAMVTRHKVAFINGSLSHNNSTELETCLYVNSSFHWLFDHSHTHTRANSCKLIVHLMHWLKTDCDLLYINCA